MPTPEGRTLIEHADRMTLEFPLGAQELQAKPHQIATLLVEYAARFIEPHPDTA